jgi:hypothetical protein
MRRNSPPSKSTSGIGSKATVRVGLVLGALAFSALHLSASPTTYTGEDIGVTGSGPLTNSNAAYTSFYSAASGIGNVSLINFESAPLGSFSSLTVAPGVTLTGSDYYSHQQSILDATDYPIAPSLDGTNTTPGGKNFVEVNGGTITFTFADPINSFGAYLTGVQNFTQQDAITFSDGSTQVIDVLEAGTSGYTGAVDFVGFTDSGASISSITIFAGDTYFDAIGVDDVSYGVPVSATPEPGSAVLLLTGCLALGLLVWQRRAAQAL